MLILKQYGLNNNFNGTKRILKAISKPVQILILAGLAITNVVSFIFILVFTSSVLGQESISGSDEIQTIEYFCTIDSSYQKALYYLPYVDGPTPLLVALHSWSGDYSQTSSINYSDYCVENNWVFIHPNFRGKNNNPDATGSDKVIQDILDAVDYAKNNSNIDTNRIYLAGASGGGHAALIAAGKGPSIWAGVSAWVPITDLVAWYTETKNMEKDYWQDISNSCGGDPTSDSGAYYEAWNRSPINFLEPARDLNIDINAGIHDGHDSYAVPISHSLLAFNELADGEDTLSRDEIDYFVNNISVPPHLQNEYEGDILYGEKKVLFRRKSNNARITVFDGIHEIIYNAACEWLSKQTLDIGTGISEYENNNYKMNFVLEQNYPNPFNPSTIINYAIPRRTKYYSLPRKVLLKVYDILGRELATLVNKYQRTGNYSVQFNGSGLASGLYFYRLTSGKFSETKIMLLIE